MSSSRKQKKTNLNESLRKIKNSTTMNKESIEDAKRKSTTLDEDSDTTSRMSFAGNETPSVKVETLQNGYLINVFSGKNCPGLLVSILEAFEKLRLEVLDARVSCEDNFQLEAVGGERHEDSMNAQMVKQEVLQAIKKWSERD